MKMISKPLIFSEKDLLYSCTSRGISRGCIAGSKLIFMRNAIYCDIFQNDYWRKAHKISSYPRRKIPFRYLPHYKIEDF